MNQFKHQDIKRLFHTTPFSERSVFLIVCIFLLVFGTACLFSSCSKQPKANFHLSEEKKEVQGLIEGIQKLKKVSSGYDLSPISQQVQDIQSSQQLLQKTTEQLKAELLSPTPPQDRQDFYAELKSIWNVGEHRPFFKRQIAACQSRLDLAVVGIGIIRVDEVLKEKNPTVKAKDQHAFISYVREQVQQAVASKDNNYKAIVFKGLQSSSN